MLSKASISGRVSDFVFTTIWLSFLNYFVAFVNYRDHAKRLSRSILIAAAAGLILALIRPVIKAWLMPILKRNRNTRVGALMRFVIFTIFFGGVTFISFMHYKEDAGWSMTRIFTGASCCGLVSGLFFTLLFLAIKKIKENRRGLQHPN